MAATKSFFTKIWQRKFTFLFVYFLVFLFTYLALVAIDFIPEPKSETDTVVPENVAATVENEALEQELLTKEIVEEVRAEEPLLPTEIFIERLDKTIEVLNPTSRAIADLDEALLKGVVRHPDSAHLSQQGNVFILGHSSYLPNVFNENYQAFNGIQNLEWGDTIQVSSGEEVFVYRVEKVFQARAEEVTVPINVKENMLTLATCDSFGSVQDRFIVEALLIEPQEA